MLISPKYQEVVISVGLAVGVQTHSPPSWGDRDSLWKSLLEPTAAPQFKAPFFRP